MTRSTDTCFMDAIDALNGYARALEKGGDVQKAINHMRVITDHARGIRQEIVKLHNEEKNETK